MDVSNNGQIDASDVAQLYVAHSESLRAYLKGLLRDDQLAADALQATFAKLIEKGHQAEKDRRKAWLFRVATNEALSIRRKKHADDQAIGRLKQEGGATPETATVDLVLKEEMLRRVRLSLSGLPSEQRRVVEMRMFEGLKFNEIAERLDTPLGTVLTRMRLAMSKLQQTLSKEDVVE